MRIQCEVCSATYTIDDAQLSDQPIGAQCPYCGHVKLVTRAEAEAAAAEAEPAAPPPAPPPFPSPQTVRNAPPAFDTAASLGFQEAPPPMPSEDMPGPSTGYPGEAPTTAYGPPPDMDMDMGPPVQAAPPEGAVSPFAASGLPASDPAGSGPELASAAEQITWAGGDGGTCSVCGTALHDEFDKVIGLCELHQRERRQDDPPVSGASPIDPVGDEWFVRPRHGGHVMGPLSLEEVRARLRSGEMGSTDQVSRDGTRFQPVDAFPELSYINALKAQAALQDPTAGTAIVRSRGGPSISFRTILIAAVVVGLGYGAYAQRQTLQRIWKNLSRGRVATLAIGMNPYQKELANWSESVPRGPVTLAELLDDAGARHLEDTWAGYASAEQSYRAALVKEVDHPDALGGYIENFSLWRLDQADPEEIKQAEAAIRFALRLEPEHPAVHRAAAALALGRQRLNQCQVHASDALKANPADGQARLLLAGCFLQGNVPLAVEEAQRAVAAEPRLRRADRVLARAYSGLGRFSSAREILERRQKVDADNAAIDIELGRLSRALGQAAEAEAHFRRALDKEGYRQAAYLELGELMLELRRPAVAIQALTASAEWADARGERASRIYTAWSRASLLDGQPAEAARLAGLALEANREYLPALVTRGEAALLVLEDDIAMQMGDRALKEGPNEPAALVLSGRANARSGQHAVALQRLRRAAENDPKDPRLRGVLAAYYLQQNQANQAYVLMREAAEVDPEESKSRSRFTPTALTDGPVKEAIEAFERSARVERNSPVAWAAIGMMYYFAGEPGQAMAAVKRSLRLDDSNYAGLIYRAQLELDAGRPQRAEKSARRLLVIERGFPLGHVLLARALADQGKTDEAREEYEAALRSNPGMLTARVELAGLDVRDGQVDEATLQELQRAYALNPNSLRLRRIMLRAGL